MQTASVWRRLQLLVLAAGPLYELLSEAAANGVGGDETCSAAKAGTGACGVGAASAGGEHFAANRAGDLNRSGFTKHRPPRDLSRPAWTFEALHGQPFHQTPVIDSEWNVYMGSDVGYAFSLDKSGKLRWKVKVGEESSQCPSLLGDRVYTASKDGVVFALDAATGEVVWRAKIAEDLPPDTYAVTAAEGIVISPANTVPGVPFGAPEVVALESDTGVVLWRYFLGLLHRSLTVNFLPVIHDGSVFFSDSNGGVYRLSLEDGKEQWARPGPDPNAFSLGGVGLGPNGVLYAGSSLSNGSDRGSVQAFGLDGTLIWERKVPLEIHAAPAMGALRPGGPLALVIGAGTPTDKPATWRQSLARKLGLMPEPYLEGIVYALDAASGETLWTFRPEPWREQAAIGSNATFWCMPDLWSLPVIASDGTVYINWSAGGVTYALRDANGDGKVDESDASEVTRYSSGSGAVGPPVIAPGMLTVGACTGMYTFLD